MLYSVTISQPDVYDGEYRLQDSKANGQPLWKMDGKSYFIYSAPKGFWVIGGQEAEEEAFDCSLGLVMSESNHKGQLPHNLKKKGKKLPWLHFDDAAEGWVEAEDISFSVGDP